MEQVTCEWMSWLAAGTRTEHLTWAPASPTHQENELGSPQKANKKAGETTRAYSTPQSASFTLLLTPTPDGGWIKQMPHMLPWNPRGKILYWRKIVKVCINHNNFKFSLPNFFSWWCNSILTSLETSTVGRSELPYMKQDYTDFTLFKRNIIFTLGPYQFWIYRCHKSLPFHYFHSDFTKKIYPAVYVYLSAGHSHWLQTGQGRQAVCTVMIISPSNSILCQVHS